MEKGFIKVESPLARGARVYLHFSISISRQFSGIFQFALKSQPRIFNDTICSLIDRHEYDDFRSADKFETVQESQIQCWLRFLIGF